MGANSTRPINHGLVHISDDGFANHETPVEDFGMFVIQDMPFPASEDEQFQIFESLLAQHE